MTGAAGDQERYDTARAEIQRDEAIRVAERDLWDAGIAHYAAPPVSTRDLGSPDLYRWCVESNRLDAENLVDEPGDER